MGFITKVGGMRKDVGQEWENAKEINPSTPKWESFWELKDLEMSQILREKVQITNLVQIGIFSY